MQFLRLLRVVTILGGLAAFNVIPGTVQAIPSGRSDLSPDPANWPVITPDNAQYLTLLGVYGHGRNTQALWGRDGHTIIVGGDRGLWLYDSRTPDAPPRALDEPDLPVRSMTISHDGRLLAVSAGHESDESDFNEAGIGGSIRIWDLTTGVLQLQVNTTPGALSFSSNDTQLIEHESYYYCCAPLDVWSVETGQLLGQFAADSFSARDPNHMDDPNAIRRFTIGQQTHLGAFIDAAGNIEVWSSTDSPLAQKDGPYGSSQIVANIPANQVISPHLHPPLIAINWPGQRLWVFDLVRLTFVDTIDLRPPSPDSDLTLSPDGIQRVVVEGGVVKLRDVKTDNLIAILRGQAIQGFAFSLDDRFVALFDGSNTVDVIDVATGQPKYTLLGHTGAVLHGAFSPDGRWLATISADQTARLWDTSKGQLQRVWSVGSNLVSLAFSPTSDELAVNTSDSIIRVWSVTTGQLLAKQLDNNFAAYDDQIVFHSSGVLSILSEGLLWQWDWHSGRTRDIRFDTPPNINTQVLAARSNGTTAVVLIRDQQNNSSVGVYELPGLDDWTDKSNYSTQHAALRLTSTCFYNGLGVVYNPAGDLMAWIYDERGNDNLRNGYIFVKSSSPGCQTVSAGGDFEKQTGSQWFANHEFSAGGRLLAATTEQGGLDIWRVAFPPLLYF